MLNRNWLWALGAVALVLPRITFAASFGTRSSAQIAPFEGGPGASVTSALMDETPTTTWAWSSDGASNATAGTPFGSNHADAVAADGITATASSLWSDTFTITSVMGAAGIAPVSFHLMFNGSLDAGSRDGGLAQMALRVVSGADQNDTDPLLPDVILDTASVSLTEPCHDESAACGAGPVATSGVLDLETEFHYGAPFRFAMLLEALAENGASAEFAASAWLERIQLPEGAVLHAASGWDYEDLAARVPEPGPLLLVALGLTALGSKSRSDR